MSTTPPAATGAHPPHAAPQIYPSLDQRYTAATLEKCARIQARQLIQVTYIAIQTSLVAALISGKIEANTFTDYTALVFGVGIPFLASIFAAWCGNQDSIIALLDSFCYELESFGLHLSRVANVPRWYDHRDRWFRASVVGRYWSNVAFGVALFGSSLSGTLMFYALGFKREAILAQASIMAAILLYRSVRLPNRRPVGVMIRYHAVTAFIVLTILGLLLACVAIVQPVPPAGQIKYPYLMLILSSLAAVSPLAIHIEFERRRLAFLDQDALDRQCRAPEVRTADGGGSDRPITDVP